MEIRFKNLPKLLSSMKYKGWIIDSFLFRYKQVDYVVILKTYSDEEIKPIKYAVAKLEFIERANTKNSICAYADFFEVHFTSTSDFCNFFRINSEDANRNLFVDFSEIFSNFIPQEKNVEKPVDVNVLQGSRCEGTNPNAIFCYDVRRNGSRDGVLNQRSIENSNKAQTLRPTLYYMYKEDKNYSFFFSPNQAEERTDEEIITLVASRN